MSKRVYEIARELNLSTKEVEERLNAAGVEVKSHFTVVEDPIYERVFGEGSEGAAPNGRSEGQQTEALPITTQSSRRDSLLFRVLVYILVGALAFGLAGSIGAVAALMMQGNLSSPAREEPRQLGDRQGAPQPQHKQQNDAAVHNENTAPEARAADEASFEQIDPKSTKAIFVQRATPQNILLNSTYLDHPATNGDPNAFILVERLSELGGDAENNAHQIGVWYDARRGGGRWAIFNQHHARMAVGATFEVVVMEGPYTLIHRATLQNTVGNSTYVDDPLTNGNPDAVLTITQNWNPGGVGNTYNDHPVGARYYADERQWVILNRDREPMPVGAAFNVVVVGDVAETE